ncbi:CoA transferase [Streptomyces griseus]|uniref:CoA transferase n=1 Tax=Streptomyces stephensoniae TaxID=3375367 RepID=A0ABU2WBC7_9ACTN|nr:CoA transferase [Streptomyces griseus]MDT0494909.1 CoA transferase [Streptomyces griseus]
MTSAPPLSPLTTSEALPLDGHLVHLPPAPPAGLATATEVVRDHLTRLGARFGPSSRSWHGSTAAARDPYTPTGPGTGHPYTPTGPETVIGLSGPHHPPGTELTLRGWPAGDPAPFDETTAQAATGLMALHGRANGGPRPLGTDFLSTLAGLTVVESTRQLQGPLATAVLRALGARVIRIEQPGGDPSRGAAPLVDGVSARFTALNAGKEVRHIDVRTAAGRRAVAETVAEADVFLHTWAPGEAARLRLDEEDLARARPGLIYAWASAWDRAPGAPRPPGTDPMVQAWSGVADTVRTPDGSPAPSLVALLDVLGGQIAAEGVLAALLARESGATTGRLRVDTSLLGASRVLLRPQLRGLDELPATTPPPTAGFVAPTADGLIAVGAAPETALAAIGDPLPPRTTKNAPAPFATAPSATWLKRLNAAGIPAREVVTDLADLPQAPSLAPYFTHDGCARPTPPWSFS